MLPEPLGIPQQAGARYVLSTVRYLHACQPASLVVAAAFGRVGENLIGFLYRPELGRGMWIVRRGVRVVLPGQLTVGILYRIRRSG
jgi:hypothetical protein